MSKFRLISVKFKLFVLFLLYSLVIFIHSLDKAPAPSVELNYGDFVFMISVQCPKEETFFMEIFFKDLPYVNYPLKKVELTTVENFLQEEYSKKHCKNSTLKIQSYSKKDKSSLDSGKIKVERKEKKKQEPFYRDDGMRGWV